MISKITIKLLKEYLKKNNIIELTYKTGLSSSKRTEIKYRLDEIK